MKSTVCYAANTNAKASFGRHFSHANNTSLILSADVGIMTSVFTVIISSISLIIKSIDKSAGYVYASS